MRGSRASTLAKSSMLGEGQKSKRQKKEKILIIDDELYFVEACRRTLEARSYQITATSSKKQAQEIEFNYTSQQVKEIFRQSRRIILSE